MSFQLVSVEAQSMQRQVDTLQPGPCAGTLCVILYLWSCIPEWMIRKYECPSSHVVTLLFWLSRFHFLKARRAAFPNLRIYAKE